MRAAVDFGLTVTDALLVDGGRRPTPGAAGAVGAVGAAVVAHTSRLRPGPASPGLLADVLEDLAKQAGPAGVPERLESIAVTGGRARELPETLNGIPIVQIDEPAAAGRGGLHAAGLVRALVVSCGTGTAMISADGAAGEYRHVGGTPVGGGTLEGLGSRLLGESNALTLCELALTGTAAAVDTTLGEVLGGSLGSLPPTATAVSLGRLARLTEEPARQDLAAGLVTMVAQTIGLIALGAARTNALEHVVLIGRLAEQPAISNMIKAVFRVYGFPNTPVAPADAGFEAGPLVALGAALLAGERQAPSGSA